MIPIAIKAVPMQDMVVRVAFADGTEKLYDASRLIADFPCFDRLRDPSLFAKVEVDAGGFGLVWGDGLDVSIEDVWEFGTTLPCSEAVSE